MSDPGWDAVLELLGQLEREHAGRLLFWKGSQRGGRDVDLLALDDSEREIGATLARCGLTRAPADPGHVLWAWPDPGRPELDLMLPAAWPEQYPPLEGVLARSVAGGSLPASSSPADCLLILAADAVAGRPVEKIARRARPLLDVARADLHELAAQSGELALARLVERPDALVAAARRGRLPWYRAGLVALHSPSARRALRHRFRAALDRRRRRPSRRLLISLSGMDGAGKSSAAATVERLAAASGWAPERRWVRLADSDSAALERIAAPIRRVLRRPERIAHQAAADPTLPVGDLGDPERRGIVAFLWVIVVATVTARSMRRAARAGGPGTAVICDRWLADAIVDLRVRYGRHAVAEQMLRVLAPRADLGFFLDVGVETAGRRKPDDQVESVLRRMAPIYAEEAGRLGLRRIDADRPAAEVAGALAEAVDELLGDAV